MNGTYFLERLELGIFFDQHQFAYRQYLSNLLRKYTRSRIDFNEWYIWIVILGYQADNFISCILICNVYGFTILIARFTIQFVKFTEITVYLGRKCSVGPADNQFASRFKNTPTEKHCEFVPQYTDEIR